MAKRGARISRSRQKPEKSPLASPAASQSTGAPLNTLSAGAGVNFPVVGFGASAGGLEAFTQVLTHLSTATGMAFVFVTHLDPKRESMLAEILSRSTSMPVTEVRHSTSVEPNHVYVAPPGTDIRIENRVLQLSPYIPKSVPHMAVDHFFRSLARDLGNKAIGVILSGTGTDGSYGIKVIKGEGGITFSQDEKSAKHDGMLHSAIASGAVDFVLPPEKIAEELARLGSHPYVAPPEPAAPEDVIPVPEEALAEILHRIHQATGVDLSQYKPNTIKRRILRRTLLVKAASLDQYVRRLQDDPEEVQALYEDMLINVTQFFREPACFDALKTEVFPNIAGQGTESLRIWVPGCSTGEEVYSLAICLLEFLEDRQYQMEIQLFGTEISDQALARARVGFYSEGIAADVSPERLKKFFIKSDRGYQIAKRIRDLCIFARQNLAKDAPFSRLDLISCRNVLIYLGAELQRRILPIFHYALKPSGYLLLGNAENVSAHSDMFTLVDKKHKIFVSRETPARLPESVNYGHNRVEVKEIPGHRVKRGSTETSSDLHKEADRLILSRYGPPGVIISGDMEVIQFRGQTGTYLEPAPGPASYNILKMARQGIMAELRNAIQRALRDDTPVRSDGLRVKHNGAYEKFDLEVIPLRRSPQRGRFLMVLFHPMKTVGPKKEQTKAALRRTKDGPSQQIQRLEEELSTTKESLQAIIEEQEASNEELRSANEEIQSSNEELQSTNEELETAKEELQSSNEELHTVNEELENRNVQLAQANDDLRNLLSSVNIPIVMVSSDLRIRRFTPQAEKVLSIIASDTGRPIANIRTNVNIPNLEQLLTEVIETLRTHEAEVQDTHGRWYLLRIRPYRTEDNKIEGAVLVLLDIDEMKKTLEEIRRARDLNQSIFETSRSSMLVLDAGSRIKLANPAFYQEFQLTPSEVVGHKIYDLAGGQWKFPKLRTLFEDILSKDGRLDGFEVDHEFPRVGRKKLLVNARRLHTDSDDQQVFLIVMDDIAHLAAG